MNAVPKPAGPYNIDYTPTPEVRKAGLALVHLLAKKQMALPPVKRLSDCINLETTTDPELVALRNVYYMAINSAVVE